LNTRDWRTRPIGKMMRPRSRLTKGERESPCF
jgi:hypothetical protein